MQRDQKLKKATVSQNTDRSESPNAGLSFFESGTSVVRFTSKKILRLSKKGRAGDPSGMLDAILTTDLPKDANSGTYALLLNPKGRILTDLTVLKDGEDLLAVVETEGAEAATETLRRYAPFSRVKIEETSLVVLGVFGPEAGSVLPVFPAENASSRVEIGGCDTLVYGVSLPATGVGIIAEAQDSSGITEFLSHSGAEVMSEEHYETARIHRATPKFGADITQESFPAEALLEERAVDFKKGCYPGQETVARMHYRGQPNKFLHRFIVEGEARPGASILQEDKAAGYLTSVAPLTVDGKIYALGYLKRRADVAGELIAGDVKLEVSIPEAL
ncbi:MAG: YgfZ/GcvT domain-containing protein [Rubrobacter sp.]